MDPRLIALGVLLVIFFIVVYYNFPAKEKLDQPQSTSVQAYSQMSDGEKIQYIIDTYFTDKTTDNESDKRAKQDAYIKSLPKDNSSCTDMFDGCAKWAADGECTINPEYMLYACAKSCSACKLTPQQKHDITVIYNSRDPAHCVSHDENYPGDFPFLNTLYDYA